MPKELFKIGVDIVNPFFNLCGLQGLIARPERNCTYPGETAELLGFTLALMRQPYVLISRSDLFNIYHTRNEMEAIKAGNLTTITSMLVMTQVRLKFFDFSSLVSQVKPVFLVAKRSRNFAETAFMPMTNFKLGLWLAFLATLLCLIAAMFSFKGVKSKQKKEYFTTFVDYLTFGLVYGFHSRSESTTAGNTAALLFGFTVLLVTNLYCAGLLAALLHPPAVRPFEDSWHMLNLVEQNKLHIIVDSNKGWFMDEVRSSNYSYYRRMREATKINRIQFVPEANIIRKLETGPYIHPTMYSTRTEYKLKKYCFLTMVGGNDLPTYWLAFAFAKNSTVLCRFNEALKNTRYSVEMLKTKYTNALRTDCVNEKELGGQPLNILSVAGVGFLLIAGCLIAGLIFLVEYIYSLITEYAKIKQLTRKAYNNMFGEVRDFVIRL